MKREWRDFAQDINHAITKAMEFIGDLTYAEFSEDEKTSSAVIRQIEIIGEAVKNIPAEIKEKYPDIPWKSMAGMRDRLIHAYFGVDLESVYSTVKDEIPRIRPLTINFMEKELKPGRPK